MTQQAHMESSIPLGRRRGWVAPVWTFIRRKPLGALGGLVPVLLVFAAVFAPFIAPYDPLAQDTPHRLLAPGREFFLGTDQFGRDIFSRIVYGSRISLYVGLLSVILGTSTGTLVGVFSAYAGGKTDLLVQRLVDGMQGIPSLIFTLAMVVALGSSLNNVTIAIAAAFAPRMVRLARAAALTVKQEDYITAARGIGCSASRVTLRHVLPNSLTPVIVLATGYLGTAIVVEASLSFLGLGVPPPQPSWGGMLQFGARRFLEAAPWMTIFPGLALTLSVFGFNLFGDALRDTLDPRLRGR